MRCRSSFAKLWLAASPLISTRVAGIPETVDAEVGWLVDPQSPDQLAGAIVAALLSERERRDRGRAGRARVLPPVGLSMLRFAACWTFLRDVTGGRHVATSTLDATWRPNAAGDRHAGGCVWSRAPTAVLRRLHDLETIPREHREHLVWVLVGERRRPRAAGQAFRILPVKRNGSRLVADDDPIRLAALASIRTIGGPGGC